MGRLTRQGMARSSATPPSGFSRPCNIPPHCSLGPLCASYFYIVHENRDGVVGLQIHQVTLFRPHQTLSEPRRHIQAAAHYGLNLVVFRYNSGVSWT